ncbi:MAG: SCO family protein [Acidobacteria bacterium]|nr:SCO family protein [Acidobacteriota bacterium]
MRQGLFSLILVLFGAAWAVAQPELPDENRFVFRKVPDVTIETAQGEIRLSEIYTESPVLLTLVYARCPGICYPYLKHLEEGLQEIRKRGYRVLVLSFDPEDDVDDLISLSETLGLRQSENWMFGVTKKVATLAQSVGFQFEWREDPGAFDHPALVAGIDRNGHVRRILAGFQKTSRLAKVIREMQGEFIPSYPLPGNDTVFRCFEYDPITGKWRMGSGLWILFAPAFMGLAGLLSLSVIIKPAAGEEGR